jgi:phosphatidylglycerol lysyltransferase
MYGVSGRCWVAMGDPVGPETEWEELVWHFRESADRHGAWIVFYEIGQRDLGLYVDLGLSLFKLGEEARVPLAEFSLDGSARKGLRHTSHRMRREGCRFEVVPASGVPALIDELAKVSEAWLAEKNTREKRFSLGRFDREYLERCPAALVRHHGEIVAFANLWLAGGGEEMSIDLMRARPNAPPGVMEHLFTELMLWGRSEHYRWFSLGMAPLAGLERRRLAPLWNQLGAVLFRYGEHFYNFQGLRAFKDKFDPVWEPRYVAAPGRLTFARSLTHVAALVSGGLRGVVAK